LARGVGDLDAVLKGVLEAQATASDERLQGLALHVLHGAEVDPLLGVDFVDRDDIRMVQSAGGAGLMDEAAAALGVGDPVRVQTLIATGRPRRASVARYTTPMPPSPRRASMR